MSKKNLGLVPLVNFAEVSDQLYRSAQPDFRYQYDWLKNTLGIKTLINLREESRYDEKMKPAGVQVFNIDVRDHEAPTMKQVTEFDRIIKDKANYPILFHCCHGHGRTSTFCILSRILRDGWDVKKAIKEERDKYHFAFQHKSQEQWLTNHFGKPAK